MTILKYDKKYRPASDVVFAIMFGNDSLFTRLAQAVTGEKIELLDKVYTQAILRENARLPSIRFDTYAELTNERIITLDMERSHMTVRLRRRLIHYTARAISTQYVVKMAYEDLEPVNVVFVLTEHNYPYPIQKIGLTDLRTHELYDDLMNITIVYVKTVIKTYKEEQEAETSDPNNSACGLPDERITTDMYTFARFFAISSQAKADTFSEEFGSTELGKELINMYHEAIADRTRLDKLSQSDYFVTRLTEAQIAYEREIAAEKAAAKAEQQTRENDIRMFLRKFSPEAVADTLELPLDQVRQIAAKHKLVY